MLKFKVSPSVTAAAVPTGTGFGAFDGKKRRCLVFAPSKTNKKALRCVKFEKKGGKPVCPDKQSGTKYKLVDAGRSPHLVRSGPCKVGRAPNTSAGAERAAAPARRSSSRRSRR